MFQINRNSSSPLTEQIFREFSDRISTGLLSVGSRLPSVRELSRSLKVSLVTVVEAYRILEDAGLVERVHGKGTFVLGDEGRRKAFEFPSPVAGAQWDWQLSIVDYLPRASVLGFRMAPGGGEPIRYKMSFASLHSSLAGSNLPADVQHIVEAQALRFSEYGPVEGLEELRLLIASYLGGMNVRATADDVLITSGVQQAIDVVARTFVGPGDVVVVEAPTYSGAIDVFRSRGATILSVPVDESGLRVDLLTRLCDTTVPKLVYTMPTFQNPTGVVMSPKRRQELLHLAQEYNFLILEDDSFSDCSFIGPPPAPIRAKDNSGHVIYIKGFSKVLSPGCRIAALLASGSIRNRLVAAKSVTDLGSPVITQILLQLYMQSNTRDGRFAAITEAVQRKRDIALDTLKRYSPKAVHVTVPRGGFNLWITLPPHVNTDALLVDALQRGLTFLPGSRCYANESIHNQLRISVAGLEDAQVREGVKLLCELFQEALSNRMDGHLPVI